MAILQALLLALSRRAGQVVNTLFGWATQLLFGKVARDKQVFISGMAFGSVAWLICLIAIAFPGVGTFLLAFIPLSKNINPNAIRLLMLALTLIVPLAVGWMGVKMLSPEDAPKTSSERIKAVLRGYPYTLGLAVTLLLMTLFAPFMILPLMAKRWTTDHVPLIVEAEAYDSLLAELEKTLTEGGWKTRRRPVSWMVGLPTRILTKLAGSMVDRFVAEKLTTLQSDKLAVMLHPADLVISGPKTEVMHARALLTEHLAFSSANQTWTKEATELENRVTVLWQQIQRGEIPLEAARQQLKRMEAERNRLDMEFEEWEVLERQQLLIERSLLEALAPSVSTEKATATETGQRLSSLSILTEEPDKAREKHNVLLGGALASGLALLKWFRRKRTREGI